MNSVWSRKLVKILGNFQNSRELTSCCRQGRSRANSYGKNKVGLKHCQIFGRTWPAVTCFSDRKVYSHHHHGHNLNLLGRRTISTLRGSDVEGILKGVQSRDGLTKSTPHIEYLIGSGGNGGGSGSENEGEQYEQLKTGGGGNTLDISDKTQLILQSSHPVRYIIEREIRALEYANRLELKYLDWVTIFGRSLIDPKVRGAQLSSSSSSTSSHQFDLHQDRLGKIATASECGMFSADVHQTVVNISANLPGRIRSEFNLGNKYAVLVGDFFAIKTIYFAEKVKSSPVFLEIIRGVEDFTYSSFAGALLDPEIGYPILPSTNASVQDWIAYNVKVSGYFTGGLKAAFVLNSLFESSFNNSGPSSSAVQDDLRTFVSNLALVLKIVGDMQEFERDPNQFSTKNVSPFLLITLPAILYQAKHPQVFQAFRDSCSANYEYDSERVREIRQKILESDSIPEAKEMLRTFAQSASQAFTRLGKDDYYSQTLQKLLTLAIRQ